MKNILILVLTLTGSISIAGFKAHADESMACEASEADEGISMAVMGMAQSQSPMGGDGYSIKRRLVSQASGRCTFEAVRVYSEAPFPNCVYSSLFRVNVSVGEFLGRRHYTIDSIEAIFTNPPAYPEWVKPFCLHMPSQP